MYTYIVIDDEELIRKGTIKKLDGMKDTVVCIGEAENGIDGIEKINELNPDIIITDMQMPYMDGMQLLPYLTEHYPEKPLIVISGFRDFDYIKQAISSKAIDYILKPFSKEAIEKCMDYAISHLEQKSDLENRIVSTDKEKEDAYYKYDLEILYNLILGYHTDSVSLSSKNLQFIEDTHHQILLTLNCTDIIADAMIQDWIEDCGYQDLVLYLPDKTNRQMAFLILFTPKKRIPDRKAADSIAQSLTLRLRQQNLNGVIGISNPCDSLSKLHEAFLETAAALNQQRIVSTGISYYYLQKETNPQSISWEHKDELLFRIEVGMTQEVKNLTHQLFAYFQTLPDCTLGDVKYYCYILSDQCRMILNYYLDQQDRQASTNSMQNVVNKMFLMENLEEYYLQFFSNISEMLRPQSVYAVEDIIERAQIYIQRNYQKNLTQEYLSSLFYINRSYLSTLFKAKTGEKFVDYLNGIRIEKSKELLSCSEKKMYQIAKAVGYDNVKYFFRIFKKKVGMTPEKYREINASSAVRKD